MSTPARVFADRYSLDVQIASSVGTPVWRALDQVLKRWVTLYLLPRSDVRSPAVISACHKAAAAMPRSAVSIIDIVEQGTIRGIPTISAAQEHLGIVTEWTEGEPLDRRLLRRSEPMPSDAALRVAQRVAVVLEQADARGLHHGRLRPHNVVFDDYDDIRITGFGVEAAMLGPDRANGAQADVQGLGNLVYAMVTGTWPEGPVDGLPAARADGPIPRPSSRNASVTEAVDRFYVGTQDGTIVSVADALRVLSHVDATTSDTRPPEETPTDTTTSDESSAHTESHQDVAPAYVPPIVIAQDPAPAMPTLGELAAQLRDTVRRTSRNRTRPRSADRGAVRRTESQGRIRSSRGSAPQVPKSRTPQTPAPARPSKPSPSGPGRPVRPAAGPLLASPDTSAWRPEVAETRKRAILIALIGVMLFGWLGWRMLTVSVGGDMAVPVSPTPSATMLNSPSPSPSASPTPTAAPGQLATIVSVRDYDPYDDGAENSAKARRAIDGNPKTAWQTTRYSAQLTKPGVGLVLNLGSAQAVTQVALTFSRPGTSVSVYISNQPAPKQRSGQLLGSVSDAGTNVVITNTTSLTGRYVLIWLTALPTIADGGYQSAIYEATVTVQ